jgi:hypothetical protein
MRQKKTLFTILLMVFVLCFSWAAATAAEVNREQPVADVIWGANGIGWTVNVNFAQLVVSVARPDGTVLSRTFDSGTAPYLDLSGIYGESGLDGSYTYELRVIPLTDKKIRKDDPEAKNEVGRLKSRETLTQTGYFQVRNGMVVTPASTSEDGLSKTMDIVHADDVIIDGSLCVGNDCYSGLAFGFDTIVMMENNLRIFFDDTSTIQNYPRNDWRIICNDSTDGGGNYFAIEDATEVSKILVLEAGAPDNSLYVDNHGDVGINTSTPYYELHIVDGDSPTVRLDQDGSYGWEPQKWDLCGNESNFFIRDATHASKLPFRIEPDAPTNSIFVKSNGYVGHGTGSPAFPLEVETTGANAAIVAQRTDGATCYINATNSNGNFGTTTNHSVRMVVNSSWKMEVTSGADIIMSDGGGYNGTWNPASSRDLKENIRDLGTEEAVEALAGLNPVKFNYKKDKEDPRVGFIAEDVPELVAMQGRKNLGTVDIIAVLTKVLQEQEKTNREQQDAIREQQRIISDLQKRIAELESK